jgi:putative SbcD/Mre11-related phosphoesterase
MLTLVENYPALLHEEKQHKSLIIADLHLGWEANLTRKGIHVPSQTLKTLRKLLQLIDKTTPDTIIIMGDIKHTVAKAEPSEWQDIPKFFETLKGKIEDIRIIRGNHDGNIQPLLPPAIQVHPSTGMMLNAIGLFHGHTWPPPKLLKCRTLVMGHVHPTIAFRDGIGVYITTPVWIKAEYNNAKLVAAVIKSKHTKKSTLKREKFAENSKINQLLIMPCFNDFLGGRPINRKYKRRKYIGPILRSEAINIDKAEVYLLDGTYLGTIEQLRGIS